MSRPIIDISSNNMNCRVGERYGIEVECEGLSNAMPPLWTEPFFKYWRTAPDGSLRNGGIEFISSPLVRASVPPALAALWPYIESGQVRPSVRTGIHIHASCLGLDTDGVLRILQHYALLEPVLFNFVGIEREENIYCIPWYRAHDEPKVVRNWLEFNGRTARAPCKYSALYVGPLRTFGTIEFRHAPTWTNRATVLLWWKMVQALFRTHSTTYNVIDRWRAVGPHEFARGVFPRLDVALPGTAVFEDADVLAVAEHLAAVPATCASGWGRAPELATRGQVAIGAPIAARGDHVHIRAPRRYVMPNLVLQGDGLTVNVNTTTVTDPDIERWIEEAEEEQPPEWYDDEPDFEDQNDVEEA